MNNAEMITTTSIINKANVSRQANLKARCFWGFSSLLATVACSC